MRSKQDPTVEEADESVGVAAGQLRLVQHDQHAEVLVPRHVGEQRQHRVGRPRVEARHRLVGEDHPRPLAEGAGNRNPLRLPARERRRPLAGDMDEPDPRERVERALPQLTREGAGRERAIEREFRRGLRRRRSRLPSGVERAARCWNTIAACRRASRSCSLPRARRSAPQSEMSPSSGSTRRNAQRSSVDLPLPFAPSTTVTSPGRTAMWMSLSTSRRPNAFRSPLISSTGVGADPIRSAPWLAADGWRFSRLR